jgi:hypothetical protein
MGMRQAAEQGRWLNRPPTGYDMINGELVPSEMAPLVRRVFELRVSGASFPAIEPEVGLKYSTVRHICENRAYLGETKLRDEWFSGKHVALVSLELFNAATGATSLRVLREGGRHRVQPAQRGHLLLQAPGAGLRPAGPSGQRGCCGQRLSLCG